MNTDESPKIGRPSEPGEYDDGMQALLQIIWGDGFLSPGGAAEVARLAVAEVIASRTLAPEEALPIFGRPPKVARPTLIPLAPSEAQAGFLERFSQLSRLMRRSAPDQAALP